MPVSLLVLLFACGAPEVVDRAPGERAPLTAACDELDPGRCLLPWPSNTFTRVDASSPTGLRLNIDQSALAVDDDASYMNLADGFSRIGGVATLIEGPANVELLSNTDVGPSIDAEGPIQVLNAQPGSSRYGERVPMFTEAFDGSSLNTERYLLIGRPQHVMEAGADHVVVVLDTIGDIGPRPRAVELALGLAEPEDDAEAAIVGYFAPIRSFLTEQGVELSRVQRVWDFTTRSEGDVALRLTLMAEAMSAAVEAGEVEVVIDSVSFPSDPNLAGIVRGRLTGAPSFLTEDGMLSVDADGLPVEVGTADIPFRVTLPAGDADWRVALYGHGTGGDVTDDLFDSEMAAQNIAKVNLRWEGWTGDTFLDTISGFSAFFKGSARSTAGLMQSLAGGSAVLTALEGPLADALSAPRIDGEANPAAGRRPSDEEIVWLGGSMGGTMGAVMTALEPRIQTAVLNVPGSGWTHMIPYSQIYEAGVGSIMLAVYDDELDLQHAMLMAQPSWDEIDGAAWGDALREGHTLLLQQVMDDPILPWMGTELLATAVGATQLGPTLSPIYGLPPQDGPQLGGAALEQFAVPPSGIYDVHGFAARDTVAGAAALEQIFTLVQGAWTGSPTLAHPTICAEQGRDGTCDFSEAWSED